MANSDKINYFIAQINNLTLLIQNIDGVQPILISIGQYQLPVDPVQFPPAYAAGAEVIKQVALGAINDYKSHISEEILAEAAAAAVTPPPAQPGTDLDQSPTIKATLVENTETAAIVAKSTVTPMTTTASKKKSS